MDNKKLRSQRLLILLLSLAIAVILGFIIAQWIMHVRSEQKITRVGAVIRMALEQTPAEENIANIRVPREIRELDYKMNEAKLAKASLQKEVQSQKKNIALLFEQSEKLKESLGTKEREISELSNQIEKNRTYETEITNLQNKIDSLDEALKTLSISHDKLQQEREVLAHWLVYTEHQQVDVNSTESTPLLHEKYLNEFLARLDSEYLISQLLDHREMELAEQELLKKRLDFETENRFAAEQELSERISRQLREQEQIEDERIQLLAAKDELQNELNKLKPLYEADRSELVSVSARYKELQEEKNQLQAKLSEMDVLGERLEVLVHHTEELEQDRSRLLAERQNSESKLLELGIYQEKYEREHNARLLAEELLSKSVSSGFTDLQVALNEKENLQNQEEKYLQEHQDRVKLEEQLAAITDRSMNDLQVYQEDKNKLVAAIEEQLNQIERLTEFHGQREKEWEQKVLEHQIIAKSNEEMQRKLAELVQQNGELVSTVTTLMDKTSSVEHSYAKSTEEIERLTKANAELYSVLEEMRGESVRLDEDLKAIAELQKALDKETNLRKTNDQMVAKLGEELTETKGRLQGLINIEEVALSEKQKREEVEQQLVTLSGQVETTITALADKGKEILQNYEKSKEEVERLKNVNKDLFAALDQRESESLQLKEGLKAVAELQKMLEAETKLRKTSDELISNLNGELTTTKDQLHQLMSVKEKTLEETQRREAAEELLAKAQADLRLIRDDQQKLAAQNADLKNTIAALNDKNKQFEEAYTQSGHEVKRLTKLNAEMVSDLDDLRAELIPLDEDLKVIADLQKKLDVEKGGRVSNEQLVAKLSEELKGAKASVQKLITVEQVALEEKRRRETLEEQVVNLEAALKTIRDYQTQERELLMAKEMDIEGLREQYRQQEVLRADLEVLVAQLTDQYESEVKGLTAVTADQTKEMESIIAELNALKERHQIENARFLEKEHLIADASQEIENRQNEMAQLKQSYSRIEKELEVTRSLVAKLQQERDAIESSKYLAQEDQDNAGIGNVKNIPIIRIHKVERGDTLTELSKKYYGTTSRWKDIQKANESILGNQNNIREGMELVIP